MTENVQIFKSFDNIRHANLSFEKMFEEIPIVLRNSHLMNILMCELEEKLPTNSQYSFLDMATGPVLENNLRFLMESVDELTQDNNKYHNYLKQYQKQQQAKHQYMSKRQLENNQRIARGEQPLPEEDITKLFKPLPAPSRLDSLLLSGQVDVFAKQLSEFADQSTAKLFMAQSLHSDGSS